MQTTLNALAPPVLSAAATGGVASTSAKDSSSPLVSPSMLGRRASASDKHVQWSEELVDTRVYDSPKRNRGRRHGSKKASAGGSGGAAVNGAPGAVDTSASVDSLSSADSSPRSTSEDQPSSARSGDVRTLTAQTVPSTEDVKAVSSTSSAASSTTPAQLQTAASAPSAQSAAPAPSLGFFDTTAAASALRPRSAAGSSVEAGLSLLAPLSSVAFDLD